MVSLFTLLLDDVTGAFTDPEGSLPFKPAGIMRLEDIGSWKRWAELHFEKLLLLASEKRTGNFPPPLVKALGFIREQYTEGIQLGDVAEKALVSAAHLSRLFTEHLKTTFVDYLTELRINEAEKLLADSSMTVKDVAYAVGYQDPNYFSRIFKRITGRLPTERQKAGEG
jgi:two-component system response regulator YesN